MARGEEELHALCVFEGPGARAGLAAPVYDPIGRVEDVVVDAVAHFAREVKQSEGTGPARDGFWSRVLGLVACDEEERAEDLLEFGDWVW